MASYLMDIICASNTFPRMSWFWNVVASLVHVYCQNLLENKYKKSYRQIHDNLFALVYNLFFCKPCKKLSFCKEAPRLYEDEML